MSLSRNNPTFGGQDAPGAAITSRQAPLSNSWRFSGEMGTGSIHHLGIRDGFDLWLSDCTFHRKMPIDSQRDPSLVYFSFMLSGCTMASSSGADTVFELTSGRQGLFTFPESGKTGWAEPDIPFRCVTIQVDPAIFFPYHEEELHRLPGALRTVIEKNRQDQFYHIRTITPAMRTALTQLLNCPHTGMARKLYLESRALELISHQLEEIGKQKKSGPARGPLSPSDRRRTRYVRDLLESRMEDPPDHLALAKAAGMSHPKLTRCFKEMYGMTPFQFLRNERLDRARTLLEKEGMNVTEAAFTVGYSSLSHFAKAYRSRFGTPPGDHCRKA